MGACGISIWPGIPWYDPSELLRTIIFVKGGEFPCDCPLHNNLVYFTCDATLTP